MILARTKTLDQTTRVAEWVKGSSIGGGQKKRDFGPKVTGLVPKITGFWSKSNGKQKYFFGPNSRYF